VRVLLDSGRALVGLLVPDEAMERLRETLARRAQMAEVNRTLGFSRTNTNSSMQFEDAVSDEGSISADEMMLLPDRRLQAPKFPTRKAVQPQKPTPKARALDIEDNPTPKRIRTAQELALEAMQEVSEMRRDVGDVGKTSQVIALDSGDEEQLEVVDDVSRHAKNVAPSKELVDRETGWLPKVQRNHHQPTNDHARETAYIAAASSSSISQDTQRSEPSTHATGESSSVHPRLLAIKARIQERLQASRAGTTVNNSIPHASAASQNSISGGSNGLQNVQAPPKYRNEIWFRKN